MTAYAPGAGIQSLGGVAGLQQDPRLLLAQQLMAQGSSEAPVYSPIQGIARALTGAMGGLQAGEVREQNIDALNKAMAELQNTNEPSKLKRFQNASAQMHANAPFMPDPFMQSSIGLMTKPDVAVAGGQRLVGYDAEGKPAVSLDMTSQTEPAKLIEDIQRIVPKLPEGPFKDFVTNNLLANARKGTLASERDTQEVTPPGQPIGVTPVGTPGFKGAVAGAVAGAQEGAKYPFDVGKAGYLKNLDIWAANNMPTAKAPEQSIVQPAPGPMPVPPVIGAPVGAPTASAAPSMPAATAPAPSPQAPPASGSTTLVPGMSPAQVTEQKGLGENLATLSKKIDEDANNAAEMKQRIPTMQAALQKLRTGVTGPAREQLARTISDLFPQEGAQWSSRIMGIDPGNAALFNSESINLVAEMVRQLGSREAQSIYQNVGKSKPNIANTPEGNQLIMGSIEQMATRAQDKRSARDAWLADPAHSKSLDGFANAFDISHRPEVYASRVTPLAMPAKDRKADAVPGAVYATPRGPALWTGQGWQIGGQPTLGMSAP